MELIKIINLHKEFKFYIFVLAAQMTIIIASYFYIIFHFAFLVSNFYQHIIIYHILGGILFFLVVWYLVKNWPDGRRLNLMSFVWLQGLTCSIDVIDLFYYKIISFFIAIFIFLITLGITTNFWDKLMIKEKDKYYGDKIFNSFLSILSFLSLIVGLIIFLFRSYI